MENSLNLGPPIEEQPKENPIITLANELAAEDYIGIPGIVSLKGAFESANDKRISWMTRRNEVETAFEHYGLDSPSSSRLGEITMLSMLRMHLVPIPCPSCVNKTYDDTRWHKVTDRGEPIRIALTTAAQRQFGDLLERVMAYWVNQTEKLQFEVVRQRDIHDAILDFGPIDRPGGTLGYVSRIETGDLGQALARLKLDSNEQWSSFMLWQVLAHEFGHLVGIGHTPTTRDHLRDIMFPIYYRIVRDIMGWSLEQVQAKYGIPATIVT